MLTFKKPHWKEIETILLDMDGTLLDLHFDNYFWLHHVPQHYAKNNNLSHQQAAEQLLNRYNEIKGHLNWYCTDFWSQELNLDISQLKTQLTDKIIIRDEVITLLSWLNKNHKRVVLVTNAHPNSVKIKMQKTNLHTHFNRIINAHDIGLAKEDESFWQKMQLTESFDKNKSLLIDDNLDVLASAKKYGIAHCFGISQPDSQGKNIQSDTFVVLDSLSDILP